MSSKRGRYLHVAVYDCVLHPKAALSQNRPKPICDDPTVGESVAPNRQVKDVIARSARLPTDVEVECNPFTDFFLRPSQVKSSVKRKSTPINSALQTGQPQNKSRRKSGLGEHGSNVLVKFESDDDAAHGSPSSRYGSVVPLSEGAIALSSPAIISHAAAAADIPSLRPLGPPGARLTPSMSRAMKATPASAGFFHGQRHIVNTLQKTAAPRSLQTILADNLVDEEGTSAPSSNQYFDSAGSKVSLLSTSVASLPGNSLSSDDAVQVKREPSSLELSSVSFGKSYSVMGSPQLNATRQERQWSIGHYEDLAAHSLRFGQPGSHSPSEQFPNETASFTNHGDLMDHTDLSSEEHWAIDDSYDLEDTDLEETDLEEADHECNTSIDGHRRLHDQGSAKYHCPYSDFRGKSIRKYIHHLGHHSWQCSNCSNWQMGYSEYKYHVNKCKNGEAATSTPQVKLVNGFCCLICKVFIADSCKLLVEHMKKDHCRADSSGTVLCPLCHTDISSDTLSSHIKKNCSMGALCNATRTQQDIDGMIIKLSTSGPDKSAAEIGSIEKLLSAHPAEAEPCIKCGEEVPYADMFTHLEQHKWKCYYCAQWSDGVSVSSFRQHIDRCEMLTRSEKRDYNSLKSYVHTYDAAFVTSVRPNSSKSDAKSKNVAKAQNSTVPAIGGSQWMVNAKLYKCPVCPSKFDSVFKIVRHINDVGHVWKCEKCSRWCNEEERESHGDLCQNTQSHELMEETEVPADTCPVCQIYTNQSQDKLFTHIDINHRIRREGGVVACPCCSGVVDKNLSLIDHLKSLCSRYEVAVASTKLDTSMSKNANGEYQCPICTNQYSSKWSLSRHMNLCSSYVTTKCSTFKSKKVNGRYQCPVCTKLYSSTWGLSRHMSDVGHVWRCTKCRKWFKEEERTDHGEQQCQPTETSETGDEVSQVPVNTCPVCKIYRNNSKQKLLHHLDMHHKGIEDTEVETGGVTSSLTGSTKSISKSNVVRKPTPKNVDYTADVGNMDSGDDDYDDVSAGYDDCDADDDDNAPEDHTSKDGVNNGYTRIHDATKDGATEEDENFHDNSESRLFSLLKPVIVLNRVDKLKQTAILSKGSTLPQPLGAEPSLKGPAALPAAPDLKCKICSSVFKTPSTYTTHKAFCGKNFQCVECFKRFAKEKSLQHHLKAHRFSLVKPSPSSVQPALRSPEYAQIDVATKQPANVPVPAVNPTCSKCNKMFLTRFSLKQHERICGEKFKCVKCVKGYPTKALLRKHVTKRHGLAIGKPSQSLVSVKKEGGTCPICQVYSNDSLAQLSVHIDTNHKISRDDGEIECPCCSTVLERNASLYDHLNNECAELRSADSTKTSPNSKTEVEQPLPDSPDVSKWRLDDGMYQCPSCPKQYKAVGGLKSHLQVVGHVWKCENCTGWFREEERDCHVEDECQGVLEPASTEEVKEAPEGTCPVCKIYSSAVKHNLRVHLDFNHKLTEKAGGIKCPCCETVIDKEETSFYGHLKLSCSKFEDLFKMDLNRSPTASAGSCNDIGTEGEEDVISSGSDYSIDGNFDDTTADEDDVEDEAYNTAVKTEPRRGRSRSGRIPRVEELKTLEKSVNSSVSNYVVIKPRPLKMEIKDEPISQTLPPGFKFLLPATRKAAKNVNSSSSTHKSKRIKKTANWKAKPKTITNSFRCDKCQSTFTLFRYYAIHMRYCGGPTSPSTTGGVFESNIGIFKCSACPEQFLTGRLLKRHMVEEVGHVWKCKICKKWFGELDRQSHYDQCEKIVDSDSEAKVGEVPAGTCPVCKIYTSDSRENFTAHIILHHQIPKDEDDDMVCPCCTEKVGKEEVDLRQHLLRKCDKVDITTPSSDRAKIFQCSVCLRVYQSYSALALHKRHIGHVWKCHKCEKWFKQQEQKSHTFTNCEGVDHSNKSNTKTEVPAGSCPVCKIYRNDKHEFRLINHIISNHKITRPDGQIRCPCCSKTIGEGDVNFKKHLMMNCKKFSSKGKKSDVACSEPVVHQCHVCEDKFSSYSSLNYHIIRVNHMMKCKKCNHWYKELKYYRHNENACQLPVVVETTEEAEPTPPDICPICKLVQCTSRLKMSYHIVYNHMVKAKDSKLECPCCRQAVVDGDFALQDHLMEECKSWPVESVAKEEADEDRITYKCSVCQQTCNSLYMFTVHLQSHVWQCNKCKEWFKYKRNDNHKEDQCQGKEKCTSSEGVPVGTCPICKIYSSRTASLLSRHIVMNHKIKMVDGKLECPCCKAVVAEREYQLQNHLVENCEKVSMPPSAQRKEDKKSAPTQSPAASKDCGKKSSKEFKCSVCSAEFFTAHMLKKHIVELVGHVWNCSKCHRWFEEEERESHAEDECQGEHITEINETAPLPRNTCSVCRIYSSKSRKQLATHLAMNHSVKREDGSLGCPCCGETPKDADTSLYVHIKACAKFEELFDKREVSGSVADTGEEANNGKQSNSECEDTDVDVEEVDSEDIERGDAGPSETEESYNSDCTTEQENLMDNESPTTVYTPEMKYKVENNFEMKASPCHICGQGTFDQHHKYIEHMVQNHSIRVPKGRIQCKDCLKVMEVDSTIKEHQRSGGCVRCIYNCQNCVKVFFTEKSHSKHMDEKHPTGNGKSKHNCGICGDSFCSSALLKKHRMIHPESKYYRSKRYPCMICDTKCMTKFDRVFHEQHEHFKNGKCYLEECNYKLSTRLHWRLRFKMATHIAQCHPSVAPPIHLCKYGCTKQFGTAQELEAHRAEQHSVKKVYKCTSCSYVANTPPALTAHKTAYHSEKTFNCDQCNFSCKWQTSLWRHKLTKHGSGNQHLCYLCGQTFTQKGSVNRHMETAHPNS